jgi:hypothetical protein
MGILNNFVNETFVGMRVEHLVEIELSVLEKLVDELAIFVIGTIEYCIGNFEYLRRQCWIVALECDFEVHAFV